MTIDAATIPHIAEETKRDFAASPTDMSASAAATSPGVMPDANAPTSGTARRFTGRTSQAL